MGEEQKPQASFLARRNAGAGAPPPAAPVPPTPDAPPAQNAVPPRAVPPAPAAPPTSPQGGMATGVFGKAKAPPAGGTIGSPMGAAPGVSSPRVSALRSPSMQSGKLVAPGASARPSLFTGAPTATGIHKAPAGRAGAPQNMSALISGQNRAFVSGQNPALVSGQNPALSKQPQVQIATAPMGPAIQQRRDPRSDAKAARSNAEVVLQRGLDHYDRSEYDLAMAAYNEAIYIDPSFAMAYNNLGMVLIDLERYQDAMNALYESIRHDANYSEAYNNLGFVLRRLGNNVDAASAYRRFLDLDPDVEEAERIEGWIESVLVENDMQAPPLLLLPPPPDQAGQVEQNEQFDDPPKIKKMAAWEAAAGDVAMAAPVNALGEYEDAPHASNFPGMNAAPGMSESEFAPKTQSMAHPQFGPSPTDSDEVAAYEPQSRRAPGEPLSEEEKNRQVALIERSLDEFANGNLDEALNLAKEAVELDDHTSEAHTALGKVLVRQEKMNEGIEALERAIQLDMTDPAPYYVLGFTFRAMERNVEAAEIYETFLRLMPDAIDGAKMRQWIMHVKGIGEADASPNLEDDGFIDNEPIVSETDKMYAAALERFKTSPASLTIDDCQRILAEAPDHVRTRMLLGRANMRDGEFEKATECFEGALDQRPDCYEALYFIGQCYEKSGDSPHALKAYRRYVEENPYGPRVEKLRAWFLSHGVDDTGRGLSQQVQCEWCLRFFDDNEISLHEGKTTCNGCLTLMGSTPIQDSNKLETVDSIDSPSTPVGVKSGGSVFTKLLLLGVGTVAALVALAFYTPYLDTYLKLAGIAKNKPKPAVRPQPQNPLLPDGPVEPGATDPKTDVVDGKTVPGTTTGTVAGTTTVSTVPTVMISPRFDSTKVKISNAPEKDFAVFTKWTWKPELEGVEELDQSLPGWKKEFIFKQSPLGMHMENGTIVWAAESRDFEALKRGEKHPVEVIVNGFWMGPEGARKDLFSTSKAFSLASQFGYDRGGELDLGLAPTARNIDIVGMDVDSDGLKDLIVSHGSLKQGSVQSVLCGPDGVKQTVTQIEGGRFAPVASFPLKGNDNAGFLAANWFNGEVKLFLPKAGRFEAARSVKMAPGILAIAAMDMGRNKTIVAGLSGAAGVLSIATYDAEAGFGKVDTVSVLGGGGTGRVIPWLSPDKGPGFVVISPLAEEPIRFIPCTNADLDKGGISIRSPLKDDGIINGAGRVMCAQTGTSRLAVVLGGKVSYVMMLEEKAGKFTEVGTKIALPGPGLGMLVYDFNKDGNDDVFVVTRDEVCFYFQNETGGLAAGPRILNPDNLGPSALMGYGTSARPDIAILTDNKHVRILKPVGSEPSPTPAAKPAAAVGNGFVPGTNAAQ